MTPSIIRHAAQPRRRRQFARAGPCKLALLLAFCAMLSAGELVSINLASGARAMAAAPAAGSSHGFATHPLAAHRAPSTCDRTCRRCADLDQQLVLPTPLRASANLTAEIVVSHCRHGLAWIPSARDGVEQLGMALSRLTVYTKCGAYDELRADPQLAGAEIHALANFGRCDHVWSFHLAHRYDTLADIVLFVKDSTFDYPIQELRSLLLNVPQVLEETRTYGFSCFRRPHLAVSSWHLRRESWKFRIASYVSADETAKLRKAQAEMKTGRLAALTADPDPFSDKRERVRSAESVEKSITSKAQFTAEMSMCEFVARALGDGPKLRSLLRETFVQICYGGSFAATAERARMHSRATYQRLELMLQRGDSIEEGHFMERLWAALLAPPMDPSIAKHFAATSGRGYAMIDGPMGISYPGCVKQCCCQRPGHDLWRRPSPIGELGPVAQGRLTFAEVLSPLASRKLRDHQLHELPHVDTPKAVILVATTLEPGAASTYLLQLGEWLRLQGFEVLCATPVGGALADTFVRLGIDIVVLPTLRLNSSSALPEAERQSAWKALSDELLTNKRPLFTSPELVVWGSVTWADVFYANDRSRWCRRAPRFIWVVPELELNAQHKWPNGFWYGHDLVVLRSPQLLRRTLLNADAVIYLSDAQRAIWQLHDHVHFHVIPPHAEHTRAQLAGSHSNRNGSASSAVPLRIHTRASLGISNSTFVISVFGPFCEHKRQHLVMDVVELLIARGDKNVHLLLVGMPSELGGRKTESAAYVTELHIRASSPPLEGRVTMLPFESEGWRHLALADLHVSAASRDAYPLNSLEAMRLGVPTIAAAAGGVGEQFQELTGSPWMLAPAGDLTAFVRAIERAYRMWKTHRDALRHLGLLQQLAAGSNAKRFAKSWTRVLERISRQSRVHEACGLWNPQTNCGSAGAYGVMRPKH